MNDSFRSRQGQDTERKKERETEATMETCVRACVRVRVCVWAVSVCMVCVYDLYLPYLLYQMRTFTYQ